MLFKSPGPLRLQVLSPQVVAFGSHRSLAVRAVVRKDAVLNNSTLAKLRIYTAPIPADGNITHGETSLVPDATPAGGRTQSRYKIPRNRAVIDERSSRTPDAATISTS